MTCFTSRERILYPPPSRGPHKMYILRGAPFGARARATALRHLCGAANYATCNAPASRRDGALLAYCPSSPTRLTRCARNNRWTFGSGTFIRFHTRGVKMSEFRDSSAGTRSEASASAFSRREEEQPRGRQADRRRAAYGDEPRGLRRGSTPN